LLAILQQYSQKLIKKLKRASALFFYGLLVIVPYLYEKGIMREFIEETHTCTKCQATIQYTNIGSWRNAKTKIGKGNKLKCQPCASKEGRDNSLKTPTGRPLGSRNSYKVFKGPEVWKNIGWHNFETRMLQIARRSGYQTYQEYRDSLPAWKAYKIDVWRITNQQTLHTLEHFSKRGVNGQTGAYTLDHIISIKKGFIENTPPERIGHISNLQMLPWEENITKGWK